ncbi:MAG: Gfo/Idh/MocA family oxidoreductase, partial [Vallitaleaceae bacterium]|nr:Gfo/Idh/MocA family oxidoreductase [Vallitaleaceae bacterium]
MKKFRVGIIGCGNIFPMHAYPVMEREDTELVAICDNKPDIMTEQSNKLGASGYTDYIEMFENANLDVVHLCTPHYLHPIMAIEALKRGIKVLTEKPMSIQAADAKAMVDASIDNKTRLGVIFQNRYNPGAKLIKSCLENGSLGKIISARAMVTWNRSDDYYALSDWKGTWEKEG